MDTNGIPYWERRYDYGPNEEFRSIIRDSFNLMVIGSMESSTSTASDGIHLNYWAANIDSAGGLIWSCLLYTSDAADERSSVDLGGRRIIKKKNRVE